MVEHYQISARNPVKASPIWQESFARNLLRLCINRGRNLEKIYAGCRSGRFGKIGCIRTPSSKNQCKRSIDATKGRLFIFPVADGRAKLSARDCEFREPTPRREPTVRSEDLRRELQGESGECRPADTVDDAEARADFWSIEGYFSYRHHHEPRLRLYVPKEETFPVPLTCIDVARSTHTDLDVLQGRTCR